MQGLSKNRIPYDEWPIILMNSGLIMLISRIKLTPGFLPGCLPGFAVDIAVVRCIVQQILWLQYSRSSWLKHGTRINWVTAFSNAVKIHRRNHFERGYLGHRKAAVSTLGNVTTWIQREGMPMNITIILEFYNEDIVCGGANLITRSQFSDPHLALNSFPSVRRASTFRCGPFSSLPAGDNKMQIKNHPKSS